MKSRSGPISACSSFTYELLLNHGKRRLVLFVLVLVSGILASAVPSRASTVGCAGASGTFDFSSLTAALNAPGALINNTIIVSGTCTESVFVSGAQNLQIIGNAGATLVDPGGNPPNFGAVLEIDNSQGVVLLGLTIQVASRSVDTAIPVVLVQSSDVRIAKCKLEGAGASDGIDIYQSTVRVIGATVIENNNDGQGDGEGVFLQGPNALLLLLNDGGGNCPLIQGNGDNGIIATGGGTAVRAPAFGGGCAIIQNNGFSGVTGNLGVTIQLGVLQANPGGVKVMNNLYGVVVTNGSHFNINGPVLIQGNTVDGIRLRNSFGNLNVSDGTSGPTIQQNGSSLNPPCCAPAAGISLGNNATLDLAGVQVTNNGGPAVIAQDNSSVRLIGPLSITHNPIGVEVTDVSSVGLFLAPSVSGNSTVDVVCGPDSAAHGDLSAVGKINCPQFRPQQNAVTPPPRRRKVIP